MVALELDETRQTRCGRTRNTFIYNKISKPERFRLGLGLKQIMPAAARFRSDWALPEVQRFCLCLRSLQMLMLWVVKKEPTCWARSSFTAEENISIKDSQGDEWHFFERNDFCSLRILLIDLPMYLVISWWQSCRYFILSEIYTLLKCKYQFPGYYTMTSNIL